MPAPAHTKLPDSSKLITATLHKEYGTDGGVTLRTLAGKLIISHVSPAVARETGLKHGLEVLTMNNVDCTVLSEISAQTLLEGDEMVTFLVQELATAFIPGTLVTAVLFKEDIDSPVGLGMKVINGQVCVGTIKEGGLAATSDLRTDMIIKKINNFDCIGLNASQAATLISDATGEVKILAEVGGTRSAKQRMNDHTTVTLTLTDEMDVDSDNEEVADTGIELMTAQSIETGMPLIIIKSISQKSPFFGTALRVGMQVCAVQNINCTEGVKMEQVANLLKDSCKQGETMMILARNSAGQRRAPGSFMTIVMTKESADTKLGLVLATKGGKVFVKKVNDGTLGSTTEIEQGMWVHSINDKYLMGKSSQEASDILKECEGHITFMCQTAGGTNLSSPSQLVTATMVKQEGDKVGLALKNKDGHLVITKNSDGCLACDTPLEVGMRIVQINNVDMSGKSNKEAAELLTSAVGLLTVMAAKPDRAAGSLVVASIEIPEVAEGEKKPSIGIKMKSTTEGNYYISGISPGSLAESTDLQVGMILKSVNNVDVASKEKLRDVLTLFTQSTGVVNVLAAVPGGTVKEVEGEEGTVVPPATTELVTACVKTGKQVPAGSIVYDEVNGKIMVTETGAGGIMFGTALRPGMEIVAINNVEATLFSKVGLENLLESRDRLMFLAKRQPLVPDVLITETLHKETQSSPLGIGLRKHSGNIYISSIKDGTLASTTRFLPGMQLVSIDNEDVVGMSALIIAKALKDAVGDITIVASTKENGLSKLNEGVSLVTAVIEKGEKDSKVGLSMIRKGGLLVITKIAEGSPTAETDLLVGMDVLSINNVDVAEMPSKEASKILAESEGNITVLAKRPSLPPGSFITAAVVKEEGISLGLKLCGLRGGGVMVKSVVPQSPASFTELEEGMVVRSINNVDTTKSTTKEVAEILKSDVRSLTILAQTTKEVAMGRSSFRSMRSLNSVRSLGESISSGMGSLHDTAKEADKHEITEVSAPSPTKDENERPDSPDLSDPPMKSIEPPESPVMDSKVSETITVVSGGKRASFTVKNVVDC